MVAMDPHEACRAEVLHHLAERADVEQPACTPQANIGLITPRLEVVDVLERTVDPGNRRSSWGTIGRSPTPALRRVQV